jgi:excisionase family DNA binding protein
MEFLSVSEAARQLGAKPKTISDLLYQRELRDDLCPIVGGRRLIPRSYLPVIRQVLIERGLLEVKSDFVTSQN